MSRNLMILLLLLATGVALADDAPEAGRVAGDTEPQAQGVAGNSATEAQAQDDAAEAERVAGATEAQKQTKDGPKLISGMSILGNQEAPKSLIIVPWKSSELGGSLGISTMLDDSKRPVDKEVFMRALSYYEIRSETTP